jgi:hypothetical protein
MFGLELGAGRVAMGAAAGCVAKKLLMEEVTLTSSPSSSS